MRRSLPYPFCVAVRSGDVQHYYFHLHNSIGFVPDQEGKLCPDLKEAREQAVRDIRSIISEEAKEGVIDLNGRIEIAGTDGEILRVVQFAQAFELRTLPGSA